MTKLEEKLIELGYEYHELYNIWEKEILNHIIHIMLSDGQIHHNEVVNHQNIIVINQQQIDNLQQAFNEMQKDLEILKECEE